MSGINSLQPSQTCAAPVGSALAVTESLGRNVAVARSVYTLVATAIVPAIGLCRLCEYPTGRQRRSNPERTP